MDIFDDCLNLLSENQLKFLEKLEKNCKVKHQSLEKSETEINNLNFPKNLEQLNDYFNKNNFILDEKEELKLSKLNDYNEECLKMIEIINNILNELENLNKEYNSISENTDKVYLNCQNAIINHKNLTTSINEIEKNLSYFKEFNLLENKLSSTQINKDLETNLAKIDNCIEFFYKNDNYLESEKYLNSFKNLQNQVLITIKNHIITTIFQNSKKVLPQSNEDLSQGENVFTLFYGKFQKFSGEIKYLIEILEKRKHFDESYENYLSECHQSFFNSRETLINPVLELTIQEMSNLNKNSTCSLTKNSAKLVLHICCNERQLFYDFFDHYSEILCEFIEKLALIFYNFLRPKIIKITHLETLAELCHILRDEIFEDESLIKFKELQPFSKIVDQLLQDTQERLIYRTNVFIQTDILEYEPVSGDLAYPQKLEMVFQTKNSNEKQELTRCLSTASISSTATSNHTFSEIALISNEINQFASNTEPIHYHLWYPTVRRTIMCLTKLFRSLDQTIFQGLAQDVISCCIASLKKASEKIEANTSALDASLFVIKHLLIIREQISPFKIECTVREVSIDFQKFKDAALNLINKSSSIFSLTTNNGLLSFLFEVQSTPQVIDQILDSQRIVDNKIKSYCEYFINHVSESITQNISDVRNFLRCCNEFIENKKISRPENSDQKKTPELSNNKNEKKDSETLEENNLMNNLNIANDETELKKDGYISVIDKFEKSLNEFIEEAYSQVISIRKKMRLYLMNDETETILFKPIKIKIVKRIEEVFNKVAIVFKNEESLLKNFKYFNEKVALEKIFSNSDFN